MGYIAGIGAANMDIRGRGEGRLIMGDSNPGMLYTTLGGVCRNICENLARLGSDVKLVTVVGDDMHGRSILEGAKKSGFCVNAGQPVIHPLWELEQKWDDLYGLFQEGTPGRPGGAKNSRVIYLP